MTAFCWYGVVCALRQAHSIRACGPSVWCVPCNFLAKTRRQEAMQQDGLIIVLPRRFGVSRLGSQDRRQLWELKRDPCDLCMYVILLYQSGGSLCHQQSTLIFHIPLTFLPFSSLPPLFLNMLVLSVFLLHMFPFGPGKRFN